MDQDRKSTKREIQEHKRLELLDREKQEKRKNLITWISITVASLLFLVFFVFLLTQGKKNTQKAEIKINSNDYIKGNQNAKLTLVEYSDFQCPACAAMNPYVNSVLKNSSKDIRFVYKHYPLPNHKNAIRAAQAVEAAGRQGKFWEMHDLMFEKQDEWAPEKDPNGKFNTYAKSLNLDLVKFGKDINATEIMDKINSNLDEGANLGLAGTPTFYINNELVDLRSYKSLQDAVNEKLK